MQVVVKDVEDLTEFEYARCRRLNFGNAGQMRDKLHEVRFEPLNSHKKAKAVMIVDQDKLVAWSLVFPMPYVRGYAAHFYVRANMRRKGYGTVLFEQVKKIDKKPWVFPHDSRSAGLLKKAPVRCYTSDEVWLKD